MCWGEEWQGIPLEALVKEGNPSAEIIKFAKEKGIDLMIIGAYGKKGISGVLFGSTAERVVRKSTCPVLMVKATEPEPT